MKTIFLPFWFFLRICSGLVGPVVGLIGVGGAFSRLIGGVGHGLCRSLLVVVFSLIGIEKMSREPQKEEEEDEQ